MFPEGDTVLESNEGGASMKGQWAWALRFISWPHFLIAPYFIHVDTVRPTTPASVAMPSPP